MRPPVSLANQYAAYLRKRYDAIATKALPAILEGWDDGDHLPHRGVRDSRGVRVDGAHDAIAKLIRIQEEHKVNPSHLENFAEEISKHNAKQLKVVGIPTRSLNSSKLVGALPNDNWLTAYETKEGWLVGTTVHRTEAAADKALFDRGISEEGFKLVKIPPKQAPLNITGGYISGGKKIYARQPFKPRPGAEPFTDIPRTPKDIEHGVFPNFERENMIPVPFSGKTALVEGSEGFSGPVIRPYGGGNIGHAVGIPTDSFRDANLALIKRLDARQVSELREVLEEAERNATRVEVLRGIIQERFDVTKSHADLIARDQTLKLNGDITRYRQQSAGVTHYEWSTSGDERVRPGHADLDGTIQDWNSPPVTNDKTGERNHPGADYQCRCVAIPILE